MSRHGLRDTPLYQRGDDEVGSRVVRMGDRAACDVVVVAPALMSGSSEDGVTSKAEPVLSGD